MIGFVFNLGIIYFFVNWFFAESMEAILQTFLKGEKRIAFFCSNVSGIEEEHLNLVPLSAAFTDKTTVLFPKKQIQIRPL